MKVISTYGFIALAALLVQCTTQSKNQDQVHPDLKNNVGELINEPEAGYRGIWYMNQPLDNEYKYKYSGGLGTYPQQHNPLAIYSAKVNKTFFLLRGHG